VIVDVTGPWRSGGLVIGGGEIRVKACGLCSAPETAGVSRLPPG
jgi:hypothetical protein